MIDMVLAGDNAIVVGLAASRVRTECAARVIFWGIAGAVVLRILFAAVTVQLLAIIGLTLAGGLLLLWVCWKMYRQISLRDHTTIARRRQASMPPTAQLMASGRPSDSIIARRRLDVARQRAGGRGRGQGLDLVLVIGLAMAIVLMAVASHYIANLLVRYPWITWIGLLIIVWVALGHDLPGLPRGDLQGLQLRLLGDSVAGHHAPWLGIADSPPGRSRAILPARH